MHGDGQRDRPPGAAMRTVGRRSGRGAVEKEAAPKKGSMDRASAGQLSKVVYVCQLKHDREIAMPANVSSSIDQQ